MGAVAAGETVALYGARETSSLGFTNDINELPGRKNIYVYLLAYFKLAAIVGFDFPQESDQFAVLEMTGTRFVHLFDFVEANLNRFVSVGLLSPNLGDEAGASLDDRHRRQICAAVGLKDTFTGDTICTDFKPVLLEPPTFPEPVVSVAIEPDTRVDQPTPLSVGWSS